MSNSALPLLINTGEPAGIGPDITLMSAIQTLSHPIVAIADHALLHQRAQQLNLKVKLVDYDKKPQQLHQPGILPILHKALNKPCQPGRLAPENGAYVIDCLKLATTMCLSGTATGLVTAPVHKACLQDAGFDFMGHTEFLAHLAGANKVVMLFVSPRLKVALLTTHIPLKEVASAISVDDLMATITILHQQLQRYFKIPNPRILVCGLNPHAGEDGHLGREEIQIITPALKKCLAQGISVSGPHPADTAFTAEKIAQSDVVLAMYHDQGLPVLKQQGFGLAVNVTLGLPFIRTSVDHGTALSLAGTGKANPNSLLSAINCAHTMANQHASTQTT